MASTDDTLLTVSLVGIGLYLLWKKLCPNATSLMDCICPGQTTIGDCIANLHFGTGGGAPGLLPFGAGGTPGSGPPGGGGAGGATVTPGTGGPGAVVNTPGTIPGTAPNQMPLPGGMPVCIDENYNVVGYPDENGICPPGTKWSFSIDVTRSLPQ